MDRCAPADRRRYRRDGRFHVAAVRLLSAHGQSAHHLGWLHSRCGNRSRLRAAHDHLLCHASTAVSLRRHLHVQSVAKHRQQHRDLRGAGAAHTQIMHSRLAEHITLYGGHLRPAAPYSFSTPQGLAALDASVTRQAQMIAYTNTFKLLLVLSLAILPLILLLKPSAPARAARP